MKLKNSMKWPTRRFQTKTIRFCLQTCFVSLFLAWPISNRYLDVLNLRWTGQQCLFIHIFSKQKVASKKLLVNYRNNLKSFTQKKLMIVGCKSIEARWGRWKWVKPYVGFDRPARRILVQFTFALIFYKKFNFGKIWFFKF